MKHHTLKMALATVCAATLLVLSGAAQAQDEQATANARAAATQGLKAYQAENWLEAIDLFERAESQFHSPVHLWYIASAAAEVDQLVRAREACLKVKREELPPDASSGVTAAHEQCSTLLDELQGRIPTLTVKVIGGEEGADYIVTRDGQEVPTAMVGIPAPVDPGEHTYSAMADGYSAPEQSIVLEEGDAETVTLELKPDPDARISEPEPVVPPGGTGASATPQDQGGGLHAPHWPAYVGAGVGLGGIAVGAVFGLDAMNAANEADDLCGGDRGQCELNEGSSQGDQVVALNNQAGDSQLISIIGYGVGGAALATGVVLWLLDVGHPSAATDEAAAPGPTIQPVIGFNHVGVTGTF